MVIRMVDISRAAAYCLLLCLLSATPVQAQEDGMQVEVSVDTRELARGETLLLTIRVHGQSQSMQLDLSALNENFEVLGTRTASQIRAVNGQVESWTDYIVTLFPLNEGELLIPSLQINNTVTAPIPINVVNAGARSNQTDDELFLETEVNKESLYVQEELLFTVRLYYTINGITNPRFTEPAIPDTVLQNIGSPNQYETLVEGVRHGVYEKRYVIYPQRSGDMEIPDILFRGEVRDGSSNTVFRNTNTRRVTAFIEGMTIEVKERPLAAQNSEHWLPATDLTLEQTYSLDPYNLKVGDSLLRSITMTGHGLDGAMLPPFSPDTIDGMNLYPNPPEIERTFSGGTVVGTRIESTTLVPTSDGEIIIPELSIAWWNIATDQMETAIIPAMPITVGAVAGAVPAEQSVAGVDNLEEVLAPDPVVDQAMIDAQAEANIIEISAAWINYAIALAIVIAAFTVYRVLIVPRQAQMSAWVITQRDRVKARYSPANNEFVAFRQLLTACDKGQALPLREVLILWCEHFVSHRSITTVEDILQQQELAPLHGFVNSLQASLYDAGSVGIDATQLPAVLKQLRRQRTILQKQEARDLRYALPPLYKF
ncbi:MAG: BatD family protein [Pseudohongiellaceae bacterium]